MPEKWKDTHGVPAPILGYKRGAKKDHPVTNEETGEIGGKHVEHYDGSVDAVITPQTVVSRSRTQKGSEDR